MSRVTVKKIDPSNPGASLRIDEGIELRNRIQEDAFRLFQSRNGRCDCAREDWLQAERELVCVPQSELVEREAGFQLRVSLPGFNAAEISVTASPYSLAVRATSSREQEENDAEVHFSEFENKPVFRRFDFSTPVNVDKIIVNLENGVLWVTAPRAKHETSPMTQALAA